jgi:hypothetical protein
MPNKTLNFLHEAIAAVAPIDGISIGRWDDKATWRIDFKAEATQEQKDAAALIVANWTDDQNYGPRWYQRAERYKSEADLYLTAADGYQREYDAEADPTKKAAIGVKRDAQVTLYLEKKALIRSELPDL